MHGCAIVNYQVAIAAMTYKAVRGFDSRGRLKGTERFSSEQFRAVPAAQVWGRRMTWNLF